MDEFVCRLPMQCPGKNEDGVHCTLAKSNCGFKEPEIMPMPAPKQKYVRKERWYEIYYRK